MDTDLRDSTSGKDPSAISVGLQKRVEQLVGPTHERRAGKDRRQARRISQGRRHSD
jgi:hypothetical protein